MKRIGILFLTVLAASCARAPVSVQAPSAPALRGELRGTVAASGVSVPLSGAEVRIGGQAAGTVGKDGSFTLRNPPPGKQSVVVEKRFPSGEVRRVLGVAVVFLSEAAMAPVSVQVRNATDVDAFCLECHPPMKQVTRRDQVYRDVHVSGVVPTHLAHVDPALLDDRGRVTCESCHAAHRPTPYPFFGVDDIKTGRFCNRCHGSS
jgi:hypothetical protein